MAPHFPIPRLSINASINAFSRAPLSGLRPAFRLLPLLAAAGLIAFSSCAEAQEGRTAGSKAAATASKDDNDTYRQLNLFGDVFERVREHYVDEVTDKQLVESAINGMLVALDPHSAYLNQNDFGEMQVQTRGEFGGLGIEVTMENGIVKVVSPIDDTPAFRAGILAGDYITHLDDEPIIGMTLSDAVDRMRGKVGTPIKLTVRREKEPEALEITLNRDIIKIIPVKHEVMMDDSIGYVRITTFNQNTHNGLRRAISDIQKKAGEKLQGYVIDLRNNPGGLLDQGIAVADDFLEKGEIVSTRGRHESDTKRDNATPGDLTNGMPLVVLINGGSASASEIVAGALQDHRRAIVLGTKSFGKGSVQTIVPLPGHGAMRLTTARYYTPSGRSIQAKGIDPDIVVEQAKIETTPQQKTIQESDLRGALDRKKTEPPAKPEETDSPSSPQGDGAAKDSGKDTKDADKTADGADEKKEEIKDYQLVRAIDLIRGVSLYQQRLETLGNTTPAQDGKQAP